MTIENVGQAFAVLREGQAGDWSARLALLTEPWSR
jgi:hypothetical protein